MFLDVIFATALAAALVWFIQGRINMRDRELLEEED